MEIKVTSSTFPIEIQEVILEILKYEEDPCKIRNSLQSFFKDIWIVIKGGSFSYAVSKSNKSAGLFKNLKTKSYYLIYTPPFTDLFVPTSTKFEQSSKIWSVFPLKQSENSKESSKVDSILKIVKDVNYDDTSAACNYIKEKVNEIDKFYWHVLVGKDFVCALPVDGVENLVYVKARCQKVEHDVVVFRKRGVQKKIDMFGFLKFSGMILLTLMFFLGVFGFIQCRNGEKKLLCEYYQPFLYIGLTFIFAKGVRMLIKKPKK
jgi:hypothetical protein